MPVAVSLLMPSHAAQVTPMQAVYSESHGRLLQDAHMFAKHHGQASAEWMTYDKNGAEFRHRRRRGGCGLLFFGQDQQYPVLFTEY